MKILENVPISFASAYAVCWSVAMPTYLSMATSSVVAIAASSAWWLGGFVAKLLRERNRVTHTDATLMSRGYCPACLCHGSLRDITSNEAWREEVTSKHIECVNCGQHFDIYPVGGKPNVIRRDGVNVVRTDDA